MTLLSQHVFGHAILVKESQNVETYMSNPKSPSMATAATQSTGTQPRFTIVARWGFPVGVSADRSDGTGSSERPCSATRSDTDIIVYKD